MSSRGKITGSRRCRIRRGSHLLLCDGVCRRAFHFDCLGYSENERDALLNSTAPWFCPECEVRQLRPRSFFYGLRWRHNTLSGTAR